MSDLIPVVAQPSVKECTGCRQAKPLSAFSAERGRRRSKCRRCLADAQRARTQANPEAKKAQDRAYYQNNADRIKAYQRNYRSANRATLRAYLAEYRRRKPGVVADASKRWNSSNTEKRRAHSALARAIRAAAVVKRETCEWCGNDLRVEAHHADYSRPLDVTWLCKMCHSAADRARQAKETTR